MLLGLVAATYTGRWQQIAVLSTEDKGEDEMALDK